jgi:hypothetical protein
LGEELTLAEIEGGIRISPVSEKYPGALHQAAPKALEDYQKLAIQELEHLRVMLHRFDPAYTLSWLTFKSNFHPWGTYYEPEDEYLGPSVGLAAHVLLESAMSKQERLVPSVHDLYGLLNQLLIIQYTGLVMETARSICDQREDPWDPRRSLRESWLFSMPTIYSRHADEVAVRLFGTSAQWLFEGLGFEFEELLRAREAIWDYIERGVNSAIAEAQDSLAAMQSKTETPSPLAFEEALLPLLPRAMSFDARRLKTREPTLDEDRLTAVLDAFSRKVSSGTDRPTSLFSESPLEAYPFIEDGDGNYYLPDFDRLAGYLVPLVEPHLANNKGYSKHRASTVDQVAIESLRRMLPGATTFEHVYYDYGKGSRDQQAEVDGLVLFDEVALVVEGKASKLSLQSRRGDVERLRRDLSRSIGDAYRQGKRATEFLQSSPIVTIKDRYGKEQASLNASSIRKVYVVIPTLHSMKYFSTNLRALRAWDVIPRDEAPWCVSLTDLMIVRDTLRRPAELIGYLEWRQRMLQDENVFFPDEIELFGSYLYGWIRPPETADSEAFVQVGGMQSDFDDWYLYLEGEALRAEQPRKQTVPMIRRFRDRMERQRPPGWLFASAYSLMIPIGLMRAAEHETRKDLRRLPARSIALRSAGPVGLVLLGQATNRAEAMATPEVVQLANTVDWVWFVRLEEDQPELVWVLPSSKPTHAT